MSLGRGGAAALLALLTAGTLLVRGAHLGARLPHTSEPDAVIVWQAGWLEAPEGVMDQNAWPAQFYPWLLARTLTLLPGRSYVADVPAGAPLEAHLAAASEPFLRGRWLSLLLSALAIPLTYRLARVWLGRWSALLAALFLATSHLHTVLSQQARPHGPQATMSLLAVLAALAYLRRGTRLRLAGAAATAALALATLHTGLFALPAAWLACLWAPRERRPRLSVATLALLAAACAAFLTFYPSPFEELHTGESGSGAPALVLGDQPLVWTDWSPRGFLRLVPGWFSHDPLLVALAAAGLALAWRRRGAGREARRSLWVAAAYPLGTIAVLGWHPWTPPRFFLGVFPYLAVLAAFALAAATERLGRACRAGGLVGVGLAALVLAGPAGVVLREEALRARPDSATRLAGVLSEKARSIPIHALPRLSAPMWMRPERIPPRPRWTWSPWINYLVRRFAGPAPPRALDVRIEARRLPELRAAAADEEALRAALRRIGRGLLVVERPSHPSVRDPLGPGMSPERLAAILGPPRLVIDGRSRRAAPLPWRLLPYACRRPFELGFLGPRFEVYFLDRLHRKAPPRPGGGR